MSVIHFQPTAGLSGDMILAALLDLGLNPAEFRSAVQSLNLGVKVKVNDVQRASLRAKRVEVILPKEEKIKPRKWPEIEGLIKNSPFSTWVKEKSLQIFQALFVAEARVHGQPVEKIHLHEAGANDALVDIIGSCWLLEKLSVSRITCSPINLGSGWVKTSHGLLPVPPPAVSELLKNIPVYSAGVEAELTTPTGAAIIAQVANSFLSFPEVKVSAVGYGAGGRDFPGFPNVLRVFWGEETAAKSSTPVYEIHANIDDATPQVLAYACEQVLNSGALDVFQTPVVMKKGRLAVQLTALAPADKIDKIIEVLFRETSTIGVRYQPVERRVLERKIEKVQVAGDEIPVKIAYFEGKIIQAQPEFEACQRIAKKKGLPLRLLQRQALESWKKKQAES